MDRKLKIAIIGAGPAGLCAARYILQSHHEVTLFEQSGEIGGNWVYTDQTGEDEYGLKIHTSMYRNLVTNFPQQLMEFPGFPNISDSDRSFVSSEKVLKYLQSFVEHFDLKKFISFRHCVIHVRPIEKTQWELIVKNLSNGYVETITYDAVFVCSGNYFKPNIPQFPGMEKFKGTQLHSHDYRRAQDYQGKDILIIGFGVSGSDLSLLVEKFAKIVTVSLRNPQKAKDRKMPETILIRENVKNVTETGAIFVDGTEKSFDTIIYCTGYKYSFPFLDVNCGVYVDENYVYPLYQHCINIFHPTMYFIGLPFWCVTYRMLDIQARYCIRFLNKEASLPTSDKMLAHTENYMKDRQTKGVPKKEWHSLETLGQRVYFNELSKEANIENVPDVLLKISYHIYHNINNDFPNYRKCFYKILDENNFECILNS